LPHKKLVAPFVFQVLEALACLLDVLQFQILLHGT
jgi:hypothetical protein